MSRIVIWLAAYGLAFLSAAFAARYGFKEADTVFDQWLRGAALFGIAIVGVHSIAWGVRLWHHRHYLLSIMVACAGLICFCVTLAGGVGTMAGSKDKLVSERSKAANMSKGVAADIARVEGDLSRLPTSRVAEAITPLIDIARAHQRFTSSNGCDPKAITRQDTREHCAEFRRLEAELGTARRRSALEAQLAELRAKDGAGDRVEVVDPQATSLARLTGFKVENAAAGYALAVSFALEIAAMMAILMNEVMTLRHEAQRAAAKAAEQSQTPPSPQTTIDATYVDLDAVKALPPPSNVVPMPPPNGLVSKFVAECLSAEPGAVTPMADIYESYRVWCEINERTPYGPRQFELNFTEICKVAEIKVEGAGDDLLARDLRFTA